MRPPSNWSSTSTKSSDWKTASATSGTAQERNETNSWRSGGKYRPGGVRHERDDLFSSYGAGLSPVGSCRPGTLRSKGTGCCRRRGSMCRPPHDRPARGRLIGSVSLPRHPGQAECGAVRCRLRRLPRRGEATQRVLRSNQRLHPQGRRGLHRHSPAATSPCRVPRPCTLWNAVEKAKSARINELKELLRLAAFCRNAKPIYDQRPVRAGYQQ